jgi:hypothetical protein
VGVDGAHVLVMLGGMVLGGIDAKVLGTRVPRDINIFIADLVRDPKVAHLHRAGPLAFDSVIGNADGSFVVTVNGRGRLGVPHFFKDEAEDLDLLRIEEEGSEISFRGRGRDQF